MAPPNSLWFCFSSIDLLLQLNDFCFCNFYPVLHKNLTTGQNGHVKVQNLIDGLRVMSCMAAMLVDRNNKIFPLWELTAIFMQIM